MSTTTLSTPNAERWYELAVCAQTDPEVFFPGPRANAMPARRICRACPVQAECLAEALAHGLPFEYSSVSMTTTVEMDDGEAR